MKTKITEGVSEEHYLSLPKAVCVIEPMGENGLEGYVRGVEYRYEFLKTKLGKDYYRVYHDASYYETCGPNKFKKFFKKLETPLNEMRGGKAENLTVYDIADKFGIHVSLINKQVVMGKKVEKEHTDSDTIAKEIAMDHLSEFPDYYTRLATLEKKASEHFNDKKVNETTKDLIKRLIRNKIK